MSEHLALTYDEALVESLLGIPYKLMGDTRAGVCCFGLVLLFFREQGIHIDHPRTYDEDKFTPFREHFRTGFDSWEYGDVIVFPKHNGIKHLGIWLPGNNMLHAHQEIGTAIIPLSRWPQQPIEHARHKCLC